MFFESSSLTKISIELRNNILQPKQYVTDICKRITRIESELHSLIPEKGRKKRLLDGVKKLEEKYPTPASRPPLYGVLIGIDDMFHVQGLPTTAGSELPPKAVAGEEADAVTLLKEAGALVLGKTVCTEFAYLKPGPTTNPYDTDFTPGGSSSGAAAAVGAGLCPLALGIQTSASIIRSSAYCGIVGFKPGLGRISTAGVIPFSQSVDQIGFFTQDIAGASLAADAIIPDWDPTLRITSKPRIALPSDAFLVQAHYDIYNPFYKMIDILTNKGCDIITHPLLKEIGEINQVHRELIAAEFALNHKKWFAEYGDLYSQPSRELYEMGRKINKTVLAANRAYQKTLMDSISEIMKRESIDVWICPSSVTSAPRGLESTGSPLMSLPWTLAGLPAISLPLGKSSHNLPMALQLIAGKGREERLLHYSTELIQMLSY